MRCVHGSLLKNLAIRQSLRNMLVRQPREKLMNVIHPNQLFLTTKDNEIRDTFFWREKMSISYSRRGEIQSGTPWSKSRRQYLKGVKSVTNYEDRVLEEDELDWASVADEFAFISRSSTPTMKRTERKCPLTS